MAEEIFVGSVAVGVVPRATGFSEDIRSQLVPAAGDIGNEWGQRCSEGINTSLGDFMGRWGESQASQAGTSGSASGERYGTAFRDKIEEIIGELPPAEVTANTTEAQAALDRLRANLDELHTKEIGVDMTDAEAMAKIEEVKAALEDLRLQDAGLMINANNSEAMAKVGEVREEIAGLETQSIITINANIDEALGKVDELRAIADRPVDIPVVMKTAGGEATLASGVERDMEEAGEVGGAGFGAKFMNKIQGLVGAGSSGMTNLGEGITGKMETMGEEAGHEFGGAFTNILGIVSKVGVPTAIAAAAVAVFAVIGEKLDTQQKQLEAALQTGGQRWDEWSGKVTQAGQMMAHYGYTQDQVDASIRQVYQVTGNMNEALGAQAEIANIAAQRHTDLTSATKLYDQALTGNARTLRQLGVVQATGTTEALALSKAQTLMGSQIQQAGGMAQFAAQHHMSLQQAQKLASDAAHGSITAYNQLGIEVLPKSATAAQNYAQVQRLLNDRLGGQAAAQAETFGGKMNALRAQFTDVAEQVGMKLLPYLEDFMSWLIKAMPTITRVGGEILKLASPVVSTFFVGLGEIIHVLTTGPLGQLDKWIVIVTVSLTALGAVLLFISANPITVTIAAIILLVGVITRFHTQIVDGLINVWNEVVHALQTAWNTISNIFTSSLNWVRHAWDDAWGAVKNTAGTVWHDIENVIKDFFGWLANTFTASLNWVKNAWDTAWTWVKDFLAAEAHGWETILHDFWGWVANIFSSSINWVRGAWNDVWHWVTDFLQAEARGWETILHDFWGWLANIFTSSINWVRGAWNDVWRWVTDFIQLEARGWETIFHDFWGWLANIFTSSLNWVKSAWNDSWIWVKNTLQNILRNVETIFHDFWGWTANVFNSSLSWVRNAWNSTWTWVKNFSAGIWHDITSAAQQFWQGITHGFQNLVTGIKNIWHGLQDAAKTPVKWVIQYVFNDGIVKIVHAIHDIIGIPDMKPIATAGWARGGVIPGWSPGVDNVLVPVSGGEGILTPEAVVGIGGPAVIDMLNRTYAGYRGGGYGNAGGGFQNGTGNLTVVQGPTGGIIQSINPNPTGDKGPLTTYGTDVGGAIVNKGANWLQKAVGFARDFAGDQLGNLLNSTLNPLINRIPGMNTGFGKWIKAAVQHWEGQIVDFIKGTMSFAGGTASAQAIVADAEKYIGHPYRYGGPSNPGKGFDCSSFVSYILGHDFGLTIPGGSWQQVTQNGAGHGPVASAYLTWSGAKTKGSDPNSAAAGDLTIWPTHIGFARGPNQMVSAFDTAKGTINTTITEGGPTGEKLTLRTIIASTGGGAAPPGGATGTAMANGLELYHYLLANLFGGHQVAAAGATASIWGESGWNPFAQGTGGRGLIGWTPPSTISDADFKGGMATQLPQIIVFVNRSGDMGVIKQMMQATSVLNAANLWGKGVERYGINDVHSTGIQIATGFMSGPPGFAAGGRPSSQWGWVGEEGPELVWFGPGSQVLSHRDSMRVTFPGGVNAGHFAAGSIPGTLPVSGGSGSLKNVEVKLDALIKATRSVGGDVGSALNTTGRVAAHRTAFGGR